MCVPGIPVKRYNPCISPLQEPIPHINMIVKYDHDGNELETYYEPNEQHYPEYSYLIQMFIDSKLKNV